MTRAEPAPPVAPAGAPVLSRRTLRNEVLVVFAVSLGASALTAIVHFLGDVTRGRPLAAQTTVLVGTAAPGRPWLDLAIHLVDIATTVAPVALAAYVLQRSGESLATLGVDTRQPARDGARGATLAAVIGGAGLGLYLIAYHVGISLTVVPASLPAVWWRVPVLVLEAVQWGVLEEILVAGYLLHRLDQMGWSRNRALGASALLRGSYHLYQGLGGFVGNLVMGLIFGRLFQRWQRAAPLVIAHTLIDVGAFVGYTYLVGKVGWLPR